MTFYEKYIQLCNSVGKSPSAVAVELKIGKPSVTRWKRGSVPRDATIAKVSDYFGVPIEYFLSSEENADTIINETSRYESVLAWTAEQMDVPDRVKKVIQSELPPSSAVALSAFTSDEQTKKPATVSGNELSSDARDILDMLSQLSPEEVALAKSRIAKIIKSR